MRRARVSPSRDVHVHVLHVGSIFHLPASYVHMCMDVCVRGSCLLTLLDSRCWHCRCVRWVGVTGGGGLEGTALRCRGKLERIVLLLYDCSYKVSVSWMVVFDP